VKSNSKYLKKKQTNSQTAFRFRSITSVSGVVAGMHFKNYSIVVWLLIRLTTSLDAKPLRMRISAQDRKLSIFCWKEEDPVIKQCLFNMREALTVKYSIWWVKILIILHLKWNNWMQKQMLFQLYCEVLLDFHNKPLFSFEFSSWGVLIMSFWISPHAWK